MCHAGDHSWIFQLGPFVYRKCGLLLWTLDLTWNTTIPDWVDFTWVDATLDVADEKW